MNAQEMFEKLGYKKASSHIEQIITNLLSYEKGLYKIDFDLLGKIYIAYKEENDEWTSIIIEIDEHQAITQQMKELGWIE